MGLEKKATKIRRERGKQIDINVKDIKIDKKNTKNIIKNETNVEWMAALEIFII